MLYGCVAYDLRMFAVNLVLTEKSRSPASLHMLCGVGRERLS